MDLRQKLEEDSKTALRNGEKRTLGALRLVLAAIKQREVDERIERLDDTQVLAVLDKLVKQRRESQEQYEKAGRQDLAEQEAFEIGVIQAYLPAALAEAEITALIEAALAETGASSIQDMGKVMAVLKPQVQGRADMGAVSKAVKAKLGSA